MAQKSNIHTSRINISYQGQVLERGEIIYTTKEKNLPYTKLQKKTHHSPILTILTSLLQPNTMMEGHDIEDFFPS
jgi:hypothetical protein